MDSNEKVTSLLRGGQWDKARYACLPRLRENRLDLQAWIYLGQALIGLGRGKMAQRCLHRAQILDPHIKGLPDVFAQAQKASPGNEDDHVMTVLALPTVTVAACILARDSARTIDRCIDALTGAIDEIVVIDTGSKDNTVEIAAAHGATVDKFAWQDDFAAARNHAQSVAKSDWILMVDSDEILKAALKPFVRETAAAYHEAQHIPVIRTTILNAQQGQVLPTRMMRMYPANRGLRWKGRIHEHLVSDSPMTVGNGLIEFDHDGYDETKVTLEDKWKRNVHLLRLAIEDEPQRVSYYYYLGRELMFLGDYTAADEHFRHALHLADRNEVTDDFTGRMYSDYANFLLFKQQDTPAATQVAQTLMERLPNHPDGYGWLALMEMSEAYGRQYVEKLAAAQGKYRHNFDLQYNLQAKLPSVFS